MLNPRGKFFFGLLFLVTVLLCSNITSASTDPFSIVPVDASFVIRVDVQKLVTLDIYEEWQSEQDAEADPEAQALYKKFVEATGIDIESDISNAVIAVLGQPGPANAGQSVAIVNGVFDPDRVVDYARERQAEEGKKLTESTYNEKKIYSLPQEDTGNKAYFSFISGNTAVFGTEKGVKAAIDTSQGTVAPITTSEKMMSLRAQVRGTPVIWGAGVLPAAPAQAQAAGPAAALQHLESIVVTVDLSPNIDLFIAGNCKTAEAAMQVNQTLNQAMGLAMMFGAQMGLSGIIQKIRLSHSGSVVELSLSLTPEDIEQLKASMERFREQQSAGGVGGLSAPGSIPFGM